MTDLSIENKARTLSGADTWSTVACAGHPTIVLADGPHGVRRPAGGGGDFGLGDSIPATCFPPAVGLASTWNRELLEAVGAALGDEARALGVGVLLGPGVNIKRSPLCGRNFEYFSEDPFVTGELAAAYVRGLQTRGVGASLKHFAANNQETNRMTVNVEVDERTLRELYFPAFETVVTREQPWTVMCSYNRVNGVLASENAWLMNHVLRAEWGFRGLVVSDWGAVDDRVAALCAGLDLEMPGPIAETRAAVLAAVKSGALTTHHLDVSVKRVHELAQRAADAAELLGTESVDDEAHHELARSAARESVVLLRNSGILPLATGKPIAVIGEFARTPRIQGAGSSQVQPTRVDAALEHLSARAPVEFAPGYTLTGADPALHTTAVELAARAQTVVLFVGLPEGEESEGFDRVDLNLPPAQLSLIRDVLAINPRTVVVLSNGGVVSLEPWHDDAAAILEAWLLGQGGGSAIAEIIFGEVNPSGRLAESIPLRIQDTPSYLNFPGDTATVRYGEGVFVGYRYYESAAVAVRYPFGHGLSYTSFHYSGLEVEKDGSRARVRVTNTGDREGKEVVQLYVSSPPGQVRRPIRELRGFNKVHLEPGASTVVEFDLPQRAYSFYDVSSSGWMCQEGTYTVAIGQSSHDMVLDQQVTLLGSQPASRLSLESGVSEWLAHPVTGPLFRRLAGANSVEGGASVLDMVGSMPMRRLMRFPGVPLTEARLRPVIALANNRAIRGIAKLFTRRSAS